MSKIKNQQGLLEAIQDAVSCYCYDNNDKDFDVTVQISAEDGWVTAERKEAKNDSI